MASVEATRFAQSVLISELAVHYYELIGLDKRRDVLEEAHISSKRSYELTRQLKKEGAETQLAVDQFHARMLLIESKLLENDQLIGEKERAIACLLGVFPFEIRRMSFEELRQIPFPLSDGVPANMLTLRPDVRAAEMELLASKADVMAAKFGSRNYCTSLPAEPDSFDVERGACFATDCLVAISRNGLEGLYGSIGFVLCRSKPSGACPPERSGDRSSPTFGHQCQ